jgi:hypothetical protein
MAIRWFLLISWHISTKLGSRKGSPPDSRKIQSFPKVVKPSDSFDTLMGGGILVFTHS